MDESKYWVFRNDHDKKMRVVEKCVTKIDEQTFIERLLKIKTHKRLRVENIEEMFYKLHPFVFWHIMNGRSLSNDKSEMLEHKRL